MLGPARLDYFVRQSPNDPLAGPFDYRTAHAQARFLSRQPSNTDGTAEVVTFVGGRVGDPPQDPATSKVQFLFVRGKLLFGGSVAEFNSAKFVGLGIGGIK